MKTIEESIKYTKDKKTFQISDPYSKYHKRIEDLQKFLVNQVGLGSVSLNFGRLSKWFHWNFIYNFLSKNILDYNLYAKSTYFSIESNNLEDFLGKKVETYDDATPFPDSIKHLAQMLYLGWEDKAVQYGQLLLKMLYGKQYKGSHPVYKHPWFMLELFCKWQQIVLDYEKLRSPENLGVYEKALAHWDSNDTTLVSGIIDELSVFHIQQSNENVDTDEYGNEFSPEFTRADYFIFPVEILMWLSIRRILGLPEYEPSTQNKLMQLDINKLSGKVFPFPKDELVEQCKTKLLKENPDIEFELKF